MKNINKIFFLLALSAGVITTSCSDDDNTGASLVDYKSPTVTLTTASTNVVVAESSIDPEDGYAITVTATIPEPVQAHLYIPLEQVGGNANSGDFELGTIAILAGTTSGSTDVTIWPGDCGTVLSGGGETLTVGAPANVANAKVSPFSMDITWVKDLLEVSLTWEGTYTYDDNGEDVTIDFCEMDLDSLILDTASGSVEYLAGTSDCTETGIISGLADGQYIIIADVYENPFYSAGLGATVPLTLSYTQCGTSNAGSFVNNTLTTNAYAPETPLTTYVFMATVDVVGTTYTVTAL